MTEVLTGEVQQRGQDGCWRTIWPFVDRRRVTVNIGGREYQADRVTFNGHDFTDAFR